MAQLIIDDPFALNIPEVLAAFTEDLDGPQKKILKSMEELFPRTRLEAETLELHGRVMLFQEADKAAKETGIPVWALDQVRDGESSQKERLISAAEFGREGGTASSMDRARKAFERVDPESARVPVLLLNCSDHVGSSQAVPVKPHPRWQRLGEPDGADLQKAMVFDIHIVKPGRANLDE